ncbi:60S acidic ribosomal protein P1 [Abrus precatorius]|uniref:60S acidic ribosomal protein P1 n=1 Tax=Abrus precatorius TaxID=3816 RepID=A0A8B8K6N4_ABRPR|nr:60S acidic ribosomal protein P1 [Abrus precatorius]
MGSSELACIYASLILHDEEIPISAEKINTLLKAANVCVESYWPGLFARLANSRNIDDLIFNCGTAGGAAVAVSAPAAAAGGGGAAAAPAAEEKKEEPKEESDDDMGFSLFD